MRGTRCRESSGPWNTGIIPAYAGNTFGISTTLQSIGDHPRVCGEHADYPLHIDVVAGSSPRMRGTHGRTQVWPIVYGIIPAYAGNTPVAYRFRQTAWDHPRVCGEHSYVCQILAVCLGSSPRMRGTLVKPCGSTRRTGIIPAYAGNTQCL